MSGTPARDVRGAGCPYQKAVAPLKRGDGRPAHHLASVMRAPRRQPPSCSFRLADRLFRQLPQAGLCEISFCDGVSSTSDGRSRRVCTTSASGRCSFRQKATPRELRRCPIRWSPSSAWHIRGCATSTGTSTCATRWASSTTPAFSFSARSPGISAGDLGWADARTEISYRSEISPGTPLTIHSRVTRVGRTSITYRHSLFGSLDKIVRSEAETVTVRFDLATRKAAELEADVRARAEALVVQDA